MSLVSKDTVRHDSKPDVSDVKMHLRSAKLCVKCLFADYYSPAGVEEAGGGT